MEIEVEVLLVLLNGIQVLELSDELVREHSILFETACYPFSETLDESALIIFKG